MLPTSIQHVHEVQFQRWLKLDTMIFNSSEISLHKMSQNYPKKSFNLSIRPNYANQADVEIKMRS
ncbi:CLUMA_CG014645, isoform A [Clunio marinus]|uniref:CLUMA_CG014645, isoform A n=1 Tax=Clunio marinus TaxID=568069 RepID=A0A1J1IS01_9DIPT|nr:CLUMA_CG014645, isoform A [Clunio marinus]